MQKNHSRSLSEIKENHVKEVEMMVENHTDELKSLAEKNQLELDTKSKRLDDILKTHRSEKDGLSNELQSQLQQSDAKFLQQQTDYAQKLSEIRDNHTLEL